jgi:hypothetical protein
MKCSGVLVVLTQITGLFPEYSDIIEDNKNRLFVDNDGR